MGIWSAVKKAVNTTIESPINHLLWLNDYKLSGEQSYVFADKTKLYELYKDGAVCLYDQWILDEALEWCAANGCVGLFFSAAYDLDDEIKIVCKSLETFEDIFGNTTVYQALLESEPAWFVFSHASAAISAITESSDAIQGIMQNDVKQAEWCGSAKCLNATLKSTVAETALANSESLQGLYDTILAAAQDSDYFTAKEEQSEYSGTDNKRYVNGETVWATTELSADDSLVFLHKIYTESADCKGTVTGLLLGDTIQGTGAGWTDVPYLFIGGLKSEPYNKSSSYDGHGVKVSVYVPK